MENGKNSIEIQQVRVTDEGRNILNDITFTVKEGESWAIVGSSGSGKTTLAKVLAGHCRISSGQVIFHLPSDFKRLYISQQHDFRDFASRAYYQQRFDSNYGTDSPVVEDVLTSVSQSETELHEVCTLLQIDYIRQRRLIELSNGEGKRVQLAKALLQRPQMIVLDSPFIGLDTVARKILHDILNSLIDKGIIIFLATTPDEIPQRIAQVLELKEGSMHKIMSRKFYQPEKAMLPENESVIASARLKDIILPEEEKFSIAVAMKNVSVSYNGKKILDGINWEVARGEKWALLGPNGAGKSTLLSLINGDNPQAYSNDIVLFDRQRGSGESIWEIKNKIGYISPELHIFFQRNPSYAEAVSITSGNDDLKGFSQSGTTCYEAIASGYNDQIGSSQKVTSLQHRQIELWMELLKISSLKSVPLYKTSLGEQRIVLLARAMVRNPAMLILDEPCQGLDKEQTHRFTTIVDAVCDYFEKTLIYVSHYSDEIPKSITKVLRLENGKVSRVTKDV